MSPSCNAFCMHQREEAKNARVQYILLEQAAHARDHDTWHALMEQALSGLNCHIIQSTSDEAPALLAYVEHHLGAHHSPDLFHVQHELVGLDHRVGHPTLFEPSPLPAAED